ncbi:hypothetical protein FOL47_000783 [Perkinsus chesapeaki]|uniref:Chitinase n=1 Tax=Perkinsus chesapeaki TaxID=330153 RepID=A0A7J6MLY0_PERCH|nr:hypothetical protein FOL47_000783 [Perkinsus chesapeaki]
MKFPSFTKGMLLHPARLQIMLTTAYVLSVSALAAASRLEFYKGIYNPWNIKESPFCSNKTLCPEEPDFTWDSYFDRLLSMGGQRFILGGYHLSDSSIVPRFEAPWNETAFLDFSNKVKSESGSILASLEIADNRHFNEKIFTTRVQSFIKKYPVSGFVLGPVWSRTDMTGLKEVLTILKKWNLTSALSFLCNEWQVLDASGLARIADLSIVMLWPSCDQVPVFNTDDHAKEAIKNATSAGAKLEGLILQVPLSAIATPSRKKYPPSEGFSHMVYDLGADPKGNGSVILDKTIQGGYYFFSQTRLVDKIALARQYKLRGIMLEGGSASTQDLFPWDKSSLFYAMASETNNTGESAGS